MVDKSLENRDSDKCIFFLASLASILPSLAASKALRISPRSFWKEEKGPEERSLELTRDAKAAMRVAKTLQEASQKAHELQGQADQARADALALKPMARLEDLHVWQMEKTKATKQGSRKYAYWMATWREGDRTRNVHQGSCAKIDQDAAWRKARALKADALVIKL